MVDLVHVVADVLVHLDPRHKGAYGAVLCFYNYPKPPSFGSVTPGPDCLLCWLQNQDGTQKQQLYVIYSPGSHSCVKGKSHTLQQSSSFCNSTLSDPQEAWQRPLGWWEHFIFWLVMMKWAFHLSLDQFSIVVLHFTIQIKK